MRSRDFAIEGYILVYHKSFIIGKSKVVCRNSYKFMSLHYLFYTPKYKVDLNSKVICYNC